MAFGYSTELSFLYIGRWVCVANVRGSVPEGHEDWFSHKKLGHRAGERRMSRLMSLSMLRFYLHPENACKYENWFVKSICRELTVAYMDPTARNGLWPCRWPRFILFYFLSEFFFRVIWSKLLFFRHATVKEYVMCHYMTPSVGSPLHHTHWNT